MIIKNNNQNSVNTTTFSVPTGPKRWARTAACSPTPSLIPRSWVTATSSNRETEARRGRGQDVEGHLDTSSCAPQEATDNTWWRPSSHRKPSSVDEGGWGHGRPRRDSRGVPSAKDELFAKRSQLCHRPLHVTLWESDAAVTGYRRPLGENLLEAKNKTRGFFFFLILKEGYRSLLQKGTCHLFPLLLGISAIVCLLKETHKICLPASLTRALQEAPKL